jgi:hypothetical protein
MLIIRDFADKVEAVRRFRSTPQAEGARVAKAVGVGYRVSLPFATGTETLVLKPADLTKLLAEFPAVSGLWELFHREPVSAQGAL